MTLRTVGARVAALLVIAATALVVPLTTAAPAQAASCAGTSGVTVIVDFGPQYGGVTAGCDAEASGERASKAFPDAGYPLTYATKDLGFVCRVSGVPASDPCTDASQADRYWSLWWADGKGGPWVYSSRGAGNLRVPEGGYLAFAFHTGSGQATPPSATPKPRVQPSQPTEEPTRATPTKPTKGPTKKPTKKPASTPTASPSSGTDGSAGGQEPPAGGATSVPTGAPGEMGSVSPSASASSSASGSSSGSPSASASGSASASPSATSTPAASASSAPSSAGADEISAGPPEPVNAAQADDQGLPLWIPIVAVLVLVGAAAAVAVRRRQA